ncbi:MAG TPA: hypothetical protein VNO81_02035 [Candidatus Nitrosotenuis sp.]|jgi:hypothetical protein|nr:hypothetical protein [Candidatus Nitrosotenuis sp.]
MRSDFDVYGRRGIVLITTLLIMVLVVMMVTAVTVSGNNSLSLTSNFHAQEAALLAAESGVQYAQLMLQQDASWPGKDHQADAPEMVPGCFYVTEDQGNVVGYLETPYGWRSQFRIRFNYYDGSGGDGGLDLSDPQNYKFSTPYVSVNNLKGSAPRYVPRAKPEDGWVVTDDSTGPYQVPAHTACIIVEGRAGWGLRNAETEASSASNRTVATRVVEAYLKLDMGENMGAAMMAGGNIEATLQSSLGLASADSSTSPGLRSKGNVIVLDESGDPGAIEVREGQEALIKYKKGGTYTAQANDQVSTGEEGASDRFRRLYWDNQADNHVKTAYNSGQGYVNLPAGTYVMHDNGKLYYYDMSYEDYARNVATLGSLSSILNAGTLVEQDFGNLITDPDTGEADSRAMRYDYDFRTGSGTVAIKKNINVQPTGNTADFAFTVARGAVVDTTGKTSLQEKLEATTCTVCPDLMADTLDAADVTFKFVSKDVEQVLFSVGTGDASESNANIRIEAQIKVKKDSGGENAAAGITSSGKIEVVGAGVNLTARPDAAEGLCLYARDDVTFNTVGRHIWKSRTYYTYADLSLTGVVYTWGDFKVKLGDERTSDWGKLKIRGALVAYGGDPATQAPGGNARGNISINAEKASLTYDSAYLASLEDSSSFGVKLKRALWATY